MSGEDSSNIEEAIEAVEGKGDEEPILLDVTLPSDSDSDKTVIVGDEKSEGMDAEDEEVAQKSEQVTTESEEVISKKKDNVKKLAKLKVGSVEGNVAGEGNIASTDDETDVSPNISPTKAYFKKPGNNEMFEKPETDSSSGSGKAPENPPFTTGTSDDPESVFSDGATVASSMYSYAESPHPSRQEREGSTSSHSEYKRLPNLPEDTSMESTVFDMSSTIEVDPFPSAEGDDVILEEPSFINYDKDTDESPTTSSSTSTSTSSRERKLADQLNLEIKDKDNKKEKKNRKRSSNSASETKSCKF